MKRIWEVFPAIAERIKRAHLEVGLVGHHDWAHAFRVGEIARQIALDEWGDYCLACLAGIAGLCHNADRLVAKRLGVGHQDVPRGSVVTIVTYWLSRDRCVFNKDGIEVVILAVLKHAEKNYPDDSRLLIALKDADRVVNLDVDLFIRSGQHYPDFPVVDYQHFLDDPEANYHNPRTALRDIAYSLDWVNSDSGICVRTRLGRRLALQRAEIFRKFFESLKEQLTEEGVYPFPPELI